MSNLVTTNARDVTASYKAFGQLLRNHKHYLASWRMEEHHTPDEAGFVTEEITTIVTEAVESAVGNAAFQQNRVHQWTSAIVESCLNQLSKLAKPYKFIVTCIILQKNGAGVHTASACFWDNSMDGSCTVRWENQTMSCIVSVFGMAI